LSASIFYVNDHETKVNINTEEDLDILNIECSQKTETQYEEIDEQVDTHQVRLCGNIPRDVTLSNRLNVAHRSQELDTVQHRRLTILFTVKKPRPYHVMSRFLDVLLAKLERNGFSILFSSLDGLVNISEYTRYSGTERYDSIVSAIDKLRGFNAAGGFSVTAEMSNGSIRFTASEVNAVKSIIREMDILVYGHLV
jgi:hypothetical protein